MKNVTQVSEIMTETEPFEATLEHEGIPYGTLKKITIDSQICKRKKNFNVLLPAGYSTNKKYPVLYVLHGYWGNEDSLLSSGDALRQIIGNAIADGEAEDMIVIFPDIYASDTQEKCDGLNPKNNRAYDNFINLLTVEIMPFVNSHYSVKIGRESTAITGFSMGGRESLNIGFSRPDLFGYVGAVAPAPGLMEDQIPPEHLKFDEIQPYVLFISAGSEDALIFSVPEEYHRQLEKNCVPHIWHYIQGGDHGGKTLRPHIYYYIRCIFKAFS